MAKVFIRAAVRADDGTERTFGVIGRNAWALVNLIQAGRRGCTPIDVPGPRWSAYVFNLRRDYGLNIETVDEPHDGPFAGTHARYVLHDDVRVVERANRHD